MKNLCQMKCRLIIAVAMFAAIFASCDKRRSFPCEISVSASGDAPFDSISMYCYEGDYHRTRAIYCGGIKNGVKLSENVNADISRVAYFKFGNDSTCYYFIIEPGEVNVRLFKNFVVTSAGGSNCNLFDLKRKLRAIDYHRNAIDSLYMKHVSDSTVTIDMERSYFEEDSLLCDSLQRTLIRFLGRGDAASIVAKQLYSKRLSANSWKELSSQGK